MNLGKTVETGRGVLEKSAKLASLPKASGLARLSRLFALLALVATATLAFSANPTLTFTGGNGAPLVITLESPVVYIATVTSGSAPAFIFKNVGDSYNGVFNTMGDITFSINGGAAQSITGTQWNFSNNDVTSNDLIFFPDFGTVTAGDIITLSSGTLTTVDNMPVSLIPTSGSYETFISDEPGNNIGSGSAVPEPTPLALAAAALAGLLLFRQACVAGKARLAATNRI